MGLFSVLYKYVRGRQLEGTYSSDPTIGIWPITSCRVLYGWGAVPENEWPFEYSKDWPPVEPPGLDKIAESFRSHGYQRVCSLEECLQAIAKGFPVLAAFNITNQWFTAKNGVIKIAKEDDEIVGGHCIDLVGYKDSSRYLKLRNSWGTKWGDKGYGYLPYDYFENQLVSAWIVYYKPIGKMEILHSEFLRGIHLSCMMVDGVVSKALIQVNLRNFSARKRIGWCFVVPHNEWLDVEEIFVLPNYRNKGYGKILCDELLSLSSKTGLPLRLWISHADDVPENQKCLSRLSSYLKLHLRNSEVTWASLRAEPNKQQNSMIEKTKPLSGPRLYLLTKNRK